MIHYDALKVDGLKDVLQAISSACKKLDIDFFVVGAIARNIWYTQGGKEAGGTEDIDFGVYVPDQETYDRLKLHLINQYKFSQANDNVFSLDSPDGNRIDLMPFGAIANDGEVVIKGSGMTRIKLDGFEEAYLHGSISTNLEEDSYKACSIAGIVILKLIAYDDRPDKKIKDIKHITSICQHYPDIETNMIWEEHSDLYGDVLSHQQVGMIVLGRLMKKIIKDNSKLLDRITSIIDKALASESDILELMITDSAIETLEDKAAILEFVKQGLTE